MKTVADGSLSCFQFEGFINTCREKWSSGLQVNSLPGPTPWSEISGSWGSGSVNFVRTFPRISRLYALFHISTSNV